MLYETLFAIYTLIKNNSKGIPQEEQMKIKYFRILYGTVFLQSNQLEFI